MTDEDPYLWLEAVTDDRSLDWARERNDVVREQFASSERFLGLRDRILAMLDTDERVPYPGRRGEWLYNYWRDGDHPKGLWRRTTFVEYCKDDPEWDVLIDVDALSAAEDENWVWAGSSVRRPAQDRALISLSRGGADASVVREFDMRTRTFLDPADGGFALPEAKSSISWIDLDTVYVGTDFGPGTLTESGYPRIGKRWRRGTPLDSAETVFEGKVTDVSAGAGYDRTPGYERHYVYRHPEFFTNETYLLAPDGTTTHIDIPADASESWYKDWLLVRLKSDWTVGAATYPAGALLATNFDDFLRGAREFEVVFEPDAHTSLNGYGWTENYLLLATLADVQTQLYVCTPGPNGWQREPFAQTPPMATTGVLNLDPLDGGDDYMMTTSSFTTPPTLLSGTIGEPATPLKAEQSYFDADGLTTEQFFATSLDGTAVPYFVVRRPGASGPTVLSGYGGFELSRTPGYNGAAGMGWLERGGITVTANIRGGGEYGPAWHTQAQKAGRHKVYEDFAAVATDLVARGITTAEQLGAVGGSNGGLLMGVMLTEYPQLFGALVCQVPLLDMKRYHLLLAGASWVAEYGNPDDPAEWEFIAKHSPYQNARADVQYPPILLTTSTRDDRVHPGHARKMTARLEEQGHRVWYYENIEGGHGGAADNAQAAFQAALVYEFLWTMLTR
ncbi:prolyl oligopeptidase family serine peptidase [Aldersonia sp. NBC_00410]|uniref:prolyl oligopeptidase family serine peptidase n=1 Tax=Aldersonia sp. NBC_00410 TaxID=2975954 RepID=UPI00225423E2|nr:prolyl oligopeptidase family serine peptidase [Aldersonia sp. NBC_00410]MCX5041888.1 prolyl oligopeptidase family serine peptidase [Aldersonia sp. NBC_00410]